MFIIVLEGIALRARVVLTMLQFRSACVNVRKLREFLPDVAGILSANFPRIRRSHFKENIQLKK